MQTKPIDELRCPVSFIQAVMEPFLRNDLGVLEASLAARLGEDPYAILSLLHRILFSERAHAEYRFSRWLLENQRLLPKEPALIDLGLCLGVYRWRTDAIRTFLDLGADPNQILMERRLPLDVCSNRLNSFYSEPKDDLEDAVDALRQAGGKGWLEWAMQSSDLDARVFGLLDTYDSWPERAVSDLAELDRKQQEIWTDILAHCAVEAKSPSKKWFAGLNALLARTDRMRLADAVAAWLGLAREPRASLIHGDLDGGPYYLASDSLKASFDLWSLGPRNAKVLKGLIWVFVHIAGAAAVERVAELAGAMYRSYPLKGLRDVALANASFEALLGTTMGREAALRLHGETKDKVARKKMDTLLAKHPA